jgi:hypothetical protein
MAMAINPLPLLLACAQDEGSGRKKYKLRSRDSRGPAERLINERPAQAT